MTEKKINCWFITIFYYVILPSVPKPSLIKTCQNQVKKAKKLIGFKLIFSLNLDIFFFVCGTL